MTRSTAILTSRSDRLLIRALYCCLFGVYGGLLPFTPLILKEQALTDREITLALSTFGLAALISPLLISHLADRLASVRTILPKLLLAITATAPLWIVLDSGLAAGLVSFLTFSAVLPSMTLLDAFTVNFTKHEQERDPLAPGFQSYRVWGSIGFLIPSCLLFLLSNFYLVGGQTIMLIVMAHALLSILLARELPPNSPLATLGTTPSREAFSAAIKPPLRGIFCATTVAGLALSIFYVLFPRFLQELGHPIQEVGLIVNLGVVFEILLIPFTGVLAQRFGARKLVLAGLLTIPLRLAIISIWPSILVVLVTQSLHAPLVVGLFVCIPVLLGQAAQDSYRFSLQSINTALVLGIARLLGPWIVLPILNSTSFSSLTALRLSLGTAAALGATAFLILLFSSTQPKSTV